MDAAALIGFVSFAILAGALLGARLAGGKNSAGELQQSLQKWFRPRVVSSVKSAVVLGRAWLTPHHSVHVIDFDGRVMIIGCHAGGMIKLGEREGRQCHEQNS
jgi:hypothetical protein